MQYLRIKTKKHEVIAAVGTFCFSAFKDVPTDSQVTCSSIHTPQQTTSSW